MSQRASPTLIGSFVVGAIVLLLVGIFLLGSGELFKKRYRFVCYFEDSVNGLREGSPVKFKGVEIGSVDQIRLPLGPDNPPVLVFFSLDADELGETADRELTQADLDRAKVQATDADLKLKRARELFDRQLIPKTDLETAESTAHSANAAVKGAEAEIVQGFADQYIGDYVNKLEQFVAGWLEFPTGGFRGASWDEQADVEYTFYGLGILGLLWSPPTMDFPGVRV